VVVISQVVTGGDLRYPFFIRDLDLAIQLPLRGWELEVAMKLSLIPVTLLTSALLIFAPSATFAQSRSGGGGHSSGSRGSSGGSRSFSASRGGGGGTARSFSGQRAPSIQRGGQSFSGQRGFAPARGYSAPYRYGYRGGGAYFGYYGAPYYYGGGYYGPSYYGNACPSGYYDRWGRWIPSPACYDPYYPY
jgi:hypothetical protein